MRSNQKKPSHPYPHPPRQKEQQEGQIQSSMHYYSLFAKKLQYNTNVHHLMSEFPANELLSYENQPNYREYVSRFIDDQVSFDQSPFSHIINFEVIPKNMNLVNKKYLPQIFFIFELQHDRYRLQSIKLKEQKKVSNKQLLKDEIYELNQMKSIINITSTYVAQTICFYKISFQSFQILFKKVIRQLFTHFHHLFTHVVQFQHNKTKENLENLSRILFQRLKVQGLDYILWPVLLLRSMDQDNKIIQTTNGQLQDQLILCLFKDIIQKKYQENKCSNGHLIRGIQKKIESFSNNERKMMINLIGTFQMTSIDQTSIFAWNIFQKQQKQLLFHTPFGIFVPIVNTFIQRLNNFKWLERSTCSKSCLFKLAQYHDNGTTNLCIPVRYVSKSKSQIKENVLIKIIQNKCPLVSKWVKQEDILVNYTLPQHQISARQLYYLIPDRISLREAINHLYAQYQNRPFSMLYILRDIFPVVIFQPTVNALQRCTLCHYRIDEEVIHCKYCLKTVHKDCILQKNNDKDGLTLYSGNIYQTESIQTIWICNNCTPCSLCCYQIDLDERFQCVKCHNIYHLQCGKLIHNEQEFIVEPFQYLCEKCLECSICKKFLHDKKYYIHDQYSLCVDCLLNFRQKYFCHECKNKKFNALDWISCINKSCPILTYHIPCHPELKPLIINKDQYFLCLTCRKIQKRKVIRWIIQEFRIFDQLQYFDDPCFESIIGYNEVISQPLSLLMMRTRATDGHYDENTYAKILDDITLISKNAMIFNMPKDEPHYRAKIMLIICKRYLQKQRNLLQTPQANIQVLKGIFLKQRQSFYQDLHKNYGSYLLNQGLSNGLIQIQHENNGNSQFIDFFSSKILLLKSFTNNKIKAKFKPEPQRIQELFISRTIPSFYNKKWKDNCYHHPQEQFPIIYQCEICWQTYCCRKSCFRHEQQIQPSTYLCKCIDPDPQQKKSLHYYLKEALAKYKINQSELTQYGKYCLKCCLANEKDRLCPLCGYICYYGFINCNSCSKRYHFQCLNKIILERFSIYRQLQEEEEEGTKKYIKLLFLEKKCIFCLNNPLHIERYAEMIKKQVQIKANKLQKVRNCSSFFAFIYSKNNIILHRSQIIHLLYDRYKQFDTICRMLELEVNRQGSQMHTLQDLQRQYEEEQREYKERVEIQDNYHRKIMTFYCNELSSQEICMDQGIFFGKSINIFVKWYFFKVIKSQYKLDDLAHKRFILNAEESLIKFDFLTFQSYLQSDSTLLYELFSKHLEEIKFETIYNYNCSYQAIYLKNRSYFQRQDNIYLQTDQLTLEDNKKYLTLPFFHLHPYKSQILSPLSYQPLFSFHLSVNIDKTLPLRPKNFYHKSNHRMNLTYLNNYSLRLYQQDKKFLKRGNTTIISDQINNWKVIKQYAGNQYILSIYKLQECWYVRVDDLIEKVDRIEQIIQVIHRYCEYVTNTCTLSQFLGLSLESFRQEPEHFTRLLKNKEFSKMSRKQRMDQVIKVFDKFSWQKNRSIIQKKVNNPQMFVPRKEKLFFLQKRQKKLKDEEYYQFQNLIVKIQQIKRQLFSNQESSVETNSDQPEISCEPANCTYVGPSIIDRIGLFVDRKLPKFTNIIQYVGQVISQRIADLRQKENRHGCYNFSISQHPNDKSQNYVIDSTYYGNMSRFINHSCEPNCKAKTIMKSGEQRIFIYSIRDLNKDEEITYDYQFKIQSTEHLICKCGSQFCQGRLN